MTDNERLANEIVEQAYARMAEGALEAGDKVVIVLARNNDKVEKLIRQVSCANGRPITFFLIWCHPHLYYWFFNNFWIVTTA